MEALEFLTNSNNSSAFASNYFGDTETALAFVKRLYEAGAVKVEVDNIYDEDWRIDREGDAYADTLFIHLPEDKGKRLDIMQVACASRPDEIDDDWNGDEPIRLWWD
jgi:hypothetical protein